MINFKQSFEVFILGISISVAMLADSFIGIASTRGSMTVDHSAVKGNANIVPGSKIETIESTSQLQLQNGAQVTLREGSSAAVFGDRMELKQGGAQIQTKNGYGVEALGFRFTPEQGEATTQISYASTNRLMVSALRGPVKVLNQEGLLLAKLSPGTSYFVEEDADPKSARGAGQQTTEKTSGKAGSRARRAGKFSRSAKIWAVTGTAAGTAASIGLVVANASN